MKTSYRMLANFNMLTTINATDDSVTLSQGNLLGYTETNFDYADLGKNTTHGRIGESSWTSMGWFFVFMPFFLHIFIFNIFIPGFGNESLAKVIYYSLFTFGILAFALRLIKEDWIWFHKKDGSVAFAIKIERNKEQAEKVIQFIKYKIIENNPVNQ